MTTYMMPVSEDLWEAMDADKLPGGMKITGIGDLNVATQQRTLTVEDANAPAELEGKTVYPVLQVRNLKAYITGYDTA